MEYDDDDKCIGSSGDARLHDADMEYDTDNICIDSSGERKMLRLYLSWMR